MTMKKPRVNIQEQKEAIMNVPISNNMNMPVMEEQEQSEEVYPAYNPNEYRYSSDPSYSRQRIRELGGRRKSKSKSKKSRKTRKTQKTRRSRK